MTLVGVAAACWRACASSLSSSSSSLASMPFLHPSTLLQVQPPAPPHLSSLSCRLSPFPLLVSCQASSVGLLGLPVSMPWTASSLAAMLASSRHLAGSACRLPACLPFIPVRCQPLLLL
jgi:hypothetical protein